MLVLTRKVGERLVIGGNIVIEVVSVSPGKVRVGVTAPREVEVLRSELVDASDGQRRSGPPSQDDDQRS